MTLEESYESISEDLFKPKLCAACGHAAVDHDSYGCGVINISSSPHPPWTWESLFAGQHQLCKCKWDGTKHEEEGKP